MSDLKATPRPQPAWLIAATVCFWASHYLYVAILSPYAEFVGASVSMVGLITASYGFSQLILRIPTGIWSDRIGKRKPFIAAGFVASALAGLWLAVTNGAWGMLGARTLSGVSATMWVIISVLFSSYFPAKRIGYAMSLLTFTMSVSQLSATLLGGLAAERWGWQAPFWGAMALGAIGLLCSLRLSEGSAKPVGLSLRELAAVGRQRRLLMVSLLGAFHQFNMWVTVYGFTPSYASSLGATKAELGWLSFISAVPIAIASLASGSVVIRYISERGMVLIGFVVSAAATIAIPLSQSLAPLYVSQALGGFGRGLILSVLMGVAIKTVPESARGTAMGFYQSIYALGMFAGPALAGVVAERAGLTGAFGSAAIVSTVGAVITFYLLRRARSGDAVSSGGASSASA